MPGTALVWAGAVAAMVLCILAVLGLWFVLNLPKQQLDRLSDAGQAFGVVSAMFSAAALSGVVASVVYQSHQARNHRYEIWQTAHANLLLRVIDEPAVYGPCIGDAGQFGSEEELRRYYFTTLWLNFGQIGLRVGTMSEASIRGELCGEMFRSQVARDLWLRRRHAVVAAYGGLGRFQAIVDEEYERSIRDTSPEPAPEASGGEASGRMPE
jgi:hypothetical protein